MSELIRFLRFQRSPNPVSLAIIVTTSRFWPWQTVEDRRCVETLPSPSPRQQVGDRDCLPRSLGRWWCVCAGGVCVGSYSMFESQAVRTDNALPKVS